MKTVGIIAEYNPFHKGHAYHIQKAKEAVGADFAVIAMSGNFVQRGAPAIIDKYTRTKMALDGGADLVLELPVPFATAAAPIFAEAGVSLFHHLGCVDALCFGSESGNVNSLIATARILMEEPPEYKMLLHNFLKEGNSYPKSVQMAVQSLGNKPGNKLDNKPDNKGNERNNELSASPNDTLAVEYIKALFKYNSAITPIAIKREGNGYHETSLSSGFASASAIRNQIEQQIEAIQTDLNASVYSMNLGRSSALSALESFLPETSFSQMEAALGHTFPVTEDDFSLALAMILNAGQMTNGMSILHAADMTPELADRIHRLLSSGKHFTFSELAEALKTKNITRARINRALLHCLLAIRQEDIEKFRAEDFCSYARILGFKKEASPLLKALKNNTDIPVITKLADAKTKLNETGNKLLSHELAASFLYRQAVWCKFHEVLPDEYRAGVIIR
jgi:predicted nucleotidyltransferase